MRNKALIFGAWSWAWSYEPLPVSRRWRQWVCGVCWIVCLDKVVNSGFRKVTQQTNKQTSKQWKTTEEDTYLCLLCPLIDKCANLHLPKSTHTCELARARVHTHTHMKHSIPSLALFVLELAAQGMGGDRSILPPVSPCEMTSVNGNDTQMTKWIDVRIPFNLLSLICQDRTTVLECNLLCKNTKPAMCQHHQVYG